MTTTPSARSLLLPAAIVALGLALAGLLAGSGFVRFRTGDRTVTVKGVAEREARADLAIWPLRIVVADDDLQRASATLEGSLGTVRRFLAAQGLDQRGDEITIGEFVVTDARSTPGGSYQPGGRYVIRQTLVVRSTHPDRVLAASQRVAELVRQGVVLTSGQEWGGGGPTFVFTPTMIAEATARAREGAEQFARDSKSALGGIRRASQGVFEILPRDQAPGISQESQLVKTERVVTTVEWALRD